METPIGRCSLCDGTVVRPVVDVGEYAQARCLACGATDAPPDVVIPMRKVSKPEAGNLAPEQPNWKEILDQLQKTQPKTQPYNEPRVIWSNPDDRFVRPLEQFPGPRLPFLGGGSMHVIDYGQYTPSGKPATSYNEPD